MVARILAKSRGDSTAEATAHGTTSKVEEEEATDSDSEGNPKMRPLKILQAQKPSVEKDQERKREDRA